MNTTLKVGAYFTVYDVEFNELAYRLGIANTLPDDLYENAVAIAQNILEPVWDTLGPQMVTSWYRSEALEREYSRRAYGLWCIENRKVIREDTWKEFITEKQHNTALAVTLRPVSVEFDGIMDVIKKLDFDVLQRKEHWISVSFSKDNRNRVIEL